MHQNSIGNILPESMMGVFKKLNETFAHDIMDEDCLFLNVWTPGLPGDSKSSTDLKPVMMFFTGGGFETTRNAREQFDASIMSAYTDSVVITFNHRLGGLGFTNLGVDDVPGNQGLYDAATALEWVIQNAATFGGDSQKLMTFGQSSGGYVIATLMTSPTYNHLIKRAIFESAVPFAPSAFFDLLEESGNFTTCAN